MKISLSKTLLKAFFIQSVGFAEIGEGFGVISQFSVYETY